MSVKSPMIRLAPVEVADLPAHSTFDSTSATNRPDLVTFATTLLDQGRALLHPTEFNLRFEHHSVKTSPPSNNDVEVLSTTVSSSELASLPWKSPALLRSKPSSINDEHWYARRSKHHNVNSKRNAPGTASWEEFVFGLRDNHSENEAAFTKDIYDARHILDWNESLNERLQAELNNSSQQTGAAPSRYSDATMSIYEMCHKLPSPTSPRCFPVLVVTASVSAAEFIAVTVPVNIASLPGAFYSNKRNKTEGADAQQKKSTTLGDYVAVERVHRYPAGTTHVDSEGHSHTHQSAPRHVASRGEGDEEIEWVMATASHARGNIPMAFQRMGVPRAIVKDVGLFLKWIHKVPEEDIRGGSKGQEASTVDRGDVAENIQ